MHAGVVKSLPCTTWFTSPFLKEGGGTFRTKCTTLAGRARSPAEAGGTIAHAVVVKSLAELALGGAFRGEFTTWLTSPFPYSLFPMKVVLCGSMFEIVAFSSKRKNIKH